MYRGGCQPLFVRIQLGGSLRDYLLDMLALDPRNALYPGFNFRVLFSDFELRGQS